MNDGLPVFRTNRRRPTPPHQLNLRCSQALEGETSNLGSPNSNMVCLGSDVERLV
jgi:hypothetical protein